MSKKKVKSRPPMSPARKQTKEDLVKTVNMVRAVKMASLLALRNRGWGNKRLKEFNDEFNTIIADVSKGYLSLVDIVAVLEKETGLKMDELEWRA